MLTNKSSRNQNLSFQPESKTTNSISMSKKDLAKEKAKAMPPTVFKVVPSRVELVPGEIKEIVIEAFGEKPQLVEELLACYSIIGKMSGKDRIMKFKVKCEFIAPLVSFSSRDLVFRCENVIVFIYLKKLRNLIYLMFYQKDGTAINIRPNKCLTVSNISSLDVTAQMNVAAPFYLVEEENDANVPELMFQLRTGESLHLNLVFDTSFKEDLHSEIVNGLLTISYAEHLHSVSQRCFIS